MNGVYRFNSDVSRDQCTIFDVEPRDRSERSVIRFELAWRVADVEDVSDVQLTQFVEAFA